MTRRVFIVSALPCPGGPRVDIARCISGQALGALLAALMPCLPPEHGSLDVRMGVDLVDPNEESPPWREV